MSTAFSRAGLSRVLDAVRQGFPGRAERVFPSTAVARVNRAVAPTCGPRSGRQRRSLPAGASRLRAGTSCPDRRTRSSPRAAGAGAPADRQIKRGQTDKTGTATSYCRRRVCSQPDEAGRAVGLSWKSSESHACLGSPDLSSLEWRIQADHVIPRGNSRQDIFVTDDDRRFDIASLREQIAEHRVSLLAWCLMTNHVHLVLVPA